MSASGLTSSMTVQLKCGILVFADSIWSERRMRVIHESIEVVVGPLPEYELKMFVLKAGELVE